jgi:hypothetical protein
MSFWWIPMESEWNMLGSTGIRWNMSFRRIPRAIPADSNIPRAISVSHVILSVTLRDQVTLLILCKHFHLCNSKYKEYFTYLREVGVVGDEGVREGE